MVAGHRTECTPAAQILIFRAVVWWQSLHGMLSPGVMLTTAKQAEVW